MASRTLDYGCQVTDDKPKNNYSDFSSENFLLDNNLLFYLTTKTKDNYFNKRKNLMIRKNVNETERNFGDRREIINNFVPNLIDLVPNLNLIDRILCLMKQQLEKTQPLLSEKNKNLTSEQNASVDLRMFLNDVAKNQIINEKSSEDDCRFKSMPKIKRVNDVGNVEKEDREDEQEENLENMPKVKFIQTLKNQEALNLNMKKTDSGVKRKLLHEDCETDSNFVKRFRESLFDEKEPVLNDADGEMNEASLWSLANEYENLTEWPLIAKHLQLTQNEINTIKLKHLKKEGLKECFYQSLLVFRQRQPENCTFEFFGGILVKKLGKNRESVKELKRHLFNRNEVKMKQKLDFYLSKLKIANKDVFLKRKLSEKNLWQCSSILFPEWKSIGRTLGLSENELIEIESKYSSTDGIRECCYQSLIQWLQYFYENASVEQLAIHLIKLNLNLFTRQTLKNLYSAEFK